MLRFLASAFVLLAGTAFAAEGMWTFDNFPIDKANRELGTDIDQAWLDRVRLASVRLGGASGGLVSSEGLILTNEHVVAGCVESVDAAAAICRDRLHPGEPRRGRACPGMTAEILTDISDVTARMQRAGAGLGGRPSPRRATPRRADRESEACGGDATRRAGRHPLPRRPVQALHLSPLRRRPARLRARAPRRRVRRRPRQFQLPALRPRCRLRPHLRGRPAGGDAEPFPLERRPAPARPAGLPVGQPGRHPAPAHPGAAAHRPGRRAPARPARRLGAARPADPVHGAERRERLHRRPDPLRHREQLQAPARPHARADRPALHGGARGGRARVPRRVAADPS